MFKTNNGRCKLLSNRQKIDEGFVVYVDDIMKRIQGIVIIYEYMDFVEI